MLVISLAAGHMSGLGFATSAAADTFDIGWLASSNGGAGHSEGECYVLTATQGQNDVGPIAAMPPFMVVSVFSSVLVSLGRSEPVSLIQSLSLIGIVTLAAGFGVTLKLTKVISRRK